MWVKRRAREKRDQVQSNPGRTACLTAGRTLGLQKSQSKVLRGLSRAQQRCRRETFPSRQSQQESFLPRQSQSRPSALPPPPSPPPPGSKREILATGSRLLPWHPFSHRAFQQWDPSPKTIKRATEEERGGGRNKGKKAGKKNQRSLAVLKIPCSNNSRADLVIPSTHKSSALHQSKLAGCQSRESLRKRGKGATWERATRNWAMEGNLVVTHTCLNQETAFPAQPMLLSCLPRSCRGCSWRSSQ